MGSGGVSASSARMMMKVEQDGALGGHLGCGIPTQKLFAKEGSSLQVKSHVSKTKVDAHIAVIISDFGMQDGLANKVKDLRGSGGLNRSFKENRRKGIQLRKNISHRSPPRTVLAEWIPNLTNEI
ncbi:hypothetical protein V6N13_099551 [Hibiscus sabdariffa]